ncbi:hypothetical protein FGB62_59g026 [Gracilaria domingensis]|nr:hypothetical protein FGB62_59g026 [Gracilaria domingensis]
MTSTFGSNHTAVQIQPHCIAQNVADLPRDSHSKSVVHRFPWRPLAETIIQVAILTLAAVVSIHARLKIFVYLFCVLAVPQLLFIVTRFQAFINVVFGRDARFHKGSPSDKLSESASFDVSEQPRFVGSVVRKTITEELGSLRAELTNFEKVAIEREEFRNLSIAQALSSLNESVLILKEDMERRDQMHPSIPYETLQELESLKTRLSFFERENASIKQQLKASQLNYEETLRSAAKARKEAEDACFRELSAREELAVAQSRILHMDELNDRLDRAESKSMQLQEELLTRAREREGFKLSADDANRRVTRMENVANMLREQLQKLSGNSSSDAQDAPVDEDEEDLQKQFWQKRLRNRGNLGRNSVVYQELLRGSRESLSKEWPSDPLGRGTSAKKEKNQALEGLPADGGFASKNLKMLESATNLANDKKILGMSGAPSQGAFSFSRSEFEEGNRRIATDKSGAREDINVNELFPKAEDLSGKPASETRDNVTDPPQEISKQSDVSGSQETLAETSNPAQTEKAAPGDQKLKLMGQSSQHGEKSGSYMQWLEKVSQNVSKEPSPRQLSDLTSESRAEKRASAAYRFPLTGESQPDMPLQSQKGSTIGGSRASTQGNGEMGKLISNTGSTQDSNQTIKQADGAQSYGEDTFCETSKNENRVRQPPKRDGNGQALSTLSESSKGTRDDSNPSPSGTKPFAKEPPLGNEKTLRPFEEGMSAREENNQQKSSVPQDDVSLSSTYGQVVEDSGQADDNSRGSNSITRTVSSKIADAQTLIEKGRSDGISVSQASSFLEQAKSILEECLKLNTLRSEVEATLGECLVAWAKLDLKDQKARWLTWKALEHLSRSVKAQPSNEKALFNSALCNALFGALSTHELAVRHQYAAAQQFDKLLKLNPSAQVAAYNGGLAYLYLARSNIAYDGENKSVIEKYFVLAIERFAKGVMLNPHDPRNAAYLETARNEMKNFMEREQEAT